jgi:hypothetical protein
MTTIATVNEKPSGVDNLVLAPIAELDRLRLRNLVLEHQLCLRQLEVLTLQFLQTAEPRTIQSRIEELTTQINASTEAIFSEHGLDQRCYQLDIDRGVFTDRQIT